MVYPHSFRWQVEVGRPIHDGKSTQENPYKNGKTYRTIIENPSEHGIFHGIHSCLMGFYGYLTSGKCLHNYGKSQFFIGKTHIFDGHVQWQNVSLPESTTCVLFPEPVFRIRQYTHR